VVEPVSEKTETVLIKGRPLCYRVRKSRRARKMGLSVSPREGVLVTLPWRVSYAAAPGLVDEYADWLDAKADEFNVRLGPRVRQYGSGSAVWVFGRPHRLEVRALPVGRSRPRFDLAEDGLLLTLPPDRILDLRPSLEIYLRRLAREDLPARVQRWSAEVGRNPRKVIIGERTSRWGSCSSRGTISLCYRLVMTPPEVIDAVVAHEVCHLVHLDHSPRFYALLDRICPGHRKTKDWLRDHHEELIL